MRSLMKVMILLLVGFAVGVVATRHRRSIAERSGYRRGREVFARQRKEMFARSQRTPLPTRPLSRAARRSSVSIAPFPISPASRPSFRDSVVNISTSTKAEPQRGFHGEEFGAPGGGGPQGGGPGDESRTRASSWSRSSGFFGPDAAASSCRGGVSAPGFIFDPDGYILTNNHASSRTPTRSLVKLNSGDEKPAKIVGRDPKTDVAVIEDRDRRAAPGDLLRRLRRRFRVGEWVMAIGNPFGLEFSVTAGIVSAKGRFIGQGNYDDFIQTDAADQPGELRRSAPRSRGSRSSASTPSIFSRSGGNIGIGFAISDQPRQGASSRSSAKRAGSPVAGWES